ncbi:MAG: hypothetical protein OXH71_02025 [Candidatus Dadabacteria bacterium]|nr:hypothetical protein [Candidatus Dadabacteria bacterium]MDE0519462.1 hypothetical protein [Candidatus Dadabacteria bacterium]MDE0663715.1 hypothetical protein [Candidatus Dadabacteria bacterium]
MIGGFVAVLAFQWKVSQDIGLLRERMAKLEGMMEVLMKTFVETRQNG